MKVASIQLKNKIPDADLETILRLEPVKPDVCAGPLSRKRMAIGQPESTNS
jgi:hypothetical protein